MQPPALLAISHGTGSPAGQRAIAALAAAVDARLPDVTVRLGHVDVQDPDVAASLSALPADQPVILVPLLLSAGYHVHVDLRDEASAREGVTVTGALGPDPRLAEVLAARLEERGLRESDTVVLAVAGSSDERANDDCRAVAALLGDRLGRSVTIGFLAAADPRLDAAVSEARSEGGRVVVGTYLMAPGYFHDLTVRMSDGAPVARPLLDDDAPAGALVEIVVDRFLAARDSGSPATS